jgi:ADP-heptose:LPS heptosyltransferase
LGKILKYGPPSHIIAFGESLGDNLLLTVLTANLNERDFKNVWIKSDRVQLFENNPHIKLVLPFNTLLSGTVLKLFGTKTVYPKYTTYNKETDSDQIPEKHIILKMADDLQLQGDIKASPVLNLTPAERTAGEWAKNTIVITTSATAALFPMRNKEWIVERYQQIVDRFKDDYQFIQLGSSTDAPLINVTDMRGKTDVRQSAAILSNAALLLSHVGFMMHLARAVDCRSVIIYGGREKPDQSGYACFENMYSAVECSPCWLHNTCHYDKKCMDLISADMAADAITKQLSLKNEPLSTDILVN